MDVQWWVAEMLEELPRIFDTALANFGVALLANFAMGRRPKSSLAAKYAFMVIPSAWASEQQALLLLIVLGVFIQFKWLTHRA